jgi:hypothetical protein
MCNLAKTVGQSLEIIERCASINRKKKKLKIMMRKTSIHIYKCKYIQNNKYSELAK